MASKAPAPAAAAAKPAAAPAAKPAAAATAGKPAAKPAGGKDEKKGAEKPAKRSSALIDTAAARPLASVVGLDGKPPAAKSIKSKNGKKDIKTGTTVRLPAVLFAPIRNDIVQFVHTSMAKNRRQAYAVSYNTGMQHSAESWGTGRAVARIPRISGGGTSRAGQGAFGNQVRGGRMFAPTKIWRKWHRKINTNQKRFAVASALAASALPALVMARGHRIDSIPEVPLVAADEIQSIKKTKDAIKFLKAVNAYADVEKAKESRKLRAGVGKMRNRRHVQRRGPLVVYAEDNGLTRAFRNLPGVEVCQVDRLNLLQLAPGGHVGRFIIWARSALDKLDENWGSITRVSTQKAGYTLPRPIMVQSDLTRLINSDEIQSKVRPAIKSVRRTRQKKNPLTNLGAMVTLNPYALALRRSELLTSTRRAALRKATVEAKRKGVKLDEQKDAKAYPLAGAAKAQKAAATAQKKADKKHKATKSTNYIRLSGAGAADRKPVVVEEAVKPMQAYVPKGKAAIKAAADAKNAPKPEAAAAKPAAEKETKAAPKADAKKADAKGDKKADAKGDKKADAKGDKKAGGDKKGDAKGDKKAGGDKKKDPKGQKADTKADKK